MGRALATIGGVLVLAAAIPHAFLGWPAAAAELRAAGVDPELVAGLGVGWYFGSVAMVALGTVVLVTAAHLRTTTWAWRVPLAVGLAYVAFGAAAFAYRAFDPHFLGFVAVGAILLAGAALARKTASRTARGS